MLYYGKSSGTYKKVSATYISFILNPAVPLAFVLNKLNVIIILCRRNKGEQDQGGKDGMVFQGQFIFIKITKFYEIRIENLC